MIGRPSRRWGWKLMKRIAFALALLPVVAVASRPSRFRIRNSKREAGISTSGQKSDSKFQTNLSVSPGSAGTPPEQEFAWLVQTGRL
jgi:hypothetical protein